MDGAAAVDFPFYTVVKAGEVFVHLFSIIQKGCGYSNHIFGLQRGFGYYFTQFAWFLMNAWGLNGSMRVESGVSCT
jgi:hypothetical protein